MAACFFYLVQCIEMVWYWGTLSQVCLLPVLVLFFVCKRSLLWMRRSYGSVVFNFMWIVVIISYRLHQPHAKNGILCPFIKILLEAFLFKSSWLPTVLPCSDPTLVTLSIIIFGVFFFMFFNIFLISSSQNDVTALNKMLCMVFWCSYTVPQQVL